METILCCYPKWPFPCLNHLLPPLQNELQGYFKGNVYWLKASWDPSAVVQTCHITDAVEYLMFSGTSLFCRNVSRSLQFWSCLSKYQFEHNFTFKKKCLFVALSHGFFCPSQELICSGPLHVLFWPLSNTFSFVLFVSREVGVCKLWAK